MDPRYMDLSWITHPADRAAITDLEELRGSQALLLPIKFPEYYLKLIRSEFDILKATNGPLYSVALPRRDRFHTFADGEVVNFVEDKDHMPGGLDGVIVHRYRNRLLYFPTDVCVGHCQYCFRPDITGLDADQKRRHSNTSDEVLESVKNYLYDHPDVYEVIFSGGDPLACPMALLEKAVTAIKSVPSVRSIRFHSKAPVFNPKLITPRLVDLLARHTIKLVLHIVHPYEITEEFAQGVKNLSSAGIWLFNQFPLLRGVNDHWLVLAELAHRCAELKVQMLTMFIADPIRYGATYRLRLQRVFEIADKVFLNSPGWISNFRVCLDSPIGKLKREHIVKHDPERDMYTFQRDGQRIQYHDVPAELDVPTPLARLLYAGTQFPFPAYAYQDDLQMSMVAAAVAATGAGERDLLR